jgi:cyclic dehypoxanthinyl futalosine synthase
MAFFRFMGGRGAGRRCGPGVAAGAEDAHEGLGGVAERGGEGDEADGSVDVHAEDGFGGVEVAGEPPARRRYHPHRRRVPGRLLQRTRINTVPTAISTLADIRAKVAASTRISPEDALTLGREATDADLRDLASQVRARYHPPNACTYMVMRIVNYTNVCVAQCDYCAFYRLPGQEGGYVLSQPQVFAKLDELLALGGDLAAFNGGFNPHLPLDYYCDLFQAIRTRYGDTLEFYALTIAEFMYLADHARLDYPAAAQRFKDAGVRWITGGGSEILTEDFRRRHSKFKYTVAEYFEAQAAIVTAGLRTTATMVIGFDETIEERIEHLDRTRTFQDLTNGLSSFLCWTFKPYFTQIGGIEITTAEYLRHLALSRIYLDNIPRIRTSVLTQNERALEGLLYGADDFDLPIEDEVTQMAGATISLNFDRILSVARDLGFTPTYRHVAPTAFTPAC